jgi:uncharacterized protein (DUF433 family)
MFGKRMRYTPNSDCPGRAERANWAGILEVTPNRAKDPRKKLRLNQVNNTLSLDWSKCPAVDSIPGKRSGAWVFKGTRMPVSTVFENLESGASSEEVMEWFDVSGSRWSLCSTLRPAVLTLRPRIAPDQRPSIHVLVDEACQDQGTPAPLISFPEGHTLTKAKDAAWAKQGRKSGAARPIHITFFPYRHHRHAPQSIR